MHPQPPEAHTYNELPNICFMPSEAEQNYQNYIKTSIGNLKASIKVIQLSGIFIHLREILQLVVPDYTEVDNLLVKSFIIITN